jgi:hypothetical protein
MAASRLMARSLSESISSSILPTEDIAKCGKSLVQQIWGRWSYFPLIFFLLLGGFRLGVGFLLLRSHRHLGSSPSLHLLSHEFSLWTWFASRLTTSLGKVTLCCTL